MEKIKHKILLFSGLLLAGGALFFSCGFEKTDVSRDRIELAGNWSFQLDPQNLGIHENWQGNMFPDSLSLPGTTDTNKKGFLNTRTDETTYLSREYFYVGKAWYTRTVEIPENWKGKSICFHMERTKPTSVWVDTFLIGKNDYISVPQEYDLSAYLTPGTHKLTIMVDNGNSVPPQLLSNSHAYTESTQTNWNGIIGDFYLEASDLCHIKDVQVYPHVEDKSITVKVTVENKCPELTNATLSLQAESWNFPDESRQKTASFFGNFQSEVERSLKKHKTEKRREKIDLSLNEFTFKLDMGDDVLLWSEFLPVLYKLNVTLKAEDVTDVREVDFGMRDFKTEGTRFVNNGKVTFLRGKHDACVFPLTGHVAMDVDTWRHYFQEARAHGINHYRFHSWCPPKACFQAADIEGVYLQPELPFWGSLNDKDKWLVSFLEKEGIAIQNAYGNHASFVMFALGNELSGNQEVMSMLTTTFRKTDDRHLYAFGSNNYLGFKGPLPGEDYYTTCRVKSENDTSFVTHARGSFSFADAYDGGYINHTYPNTEMNFSSAVERCNVPIISHETGQYQMYPNFEEMEKYTGVLKPSNYAVFQQRLKDAGMEDQAIWFFLASGRWAAFLYRAEMEMDFRTPGLGGFQLLDLQDYPGQGSAFVGILDAFMDRKGVMYAEEWRMSCNEVVPLFVTPKFCWTGGETFSGEIKVANYGPDKLNGKLVWAVLDRTDKGVFAGSSPIEVGQGELSSVITIREKFPEPKYAVRLDLLVSIEGTPYSNTYPIWLYPSELNDTVPEGILVTRQMDAKASDALKKGGKVLWFPEKDALKNVTVGGLFQTDYWNYRMFKSICESIKKPVSPGTLGILTSEGHPVFNDFPTDFYTNWQWFPIIKQSYPMILDRLPFEYRPIVQVIDNVERNHRLGLIFEFEVDGGKLLVCMSDLESVKDKPEVRQLYASMLQYMDSESFNPTFKLSLSGLKDLFSSEIKSDKIEALQNISYE